MVSRTTWLRKATINTSECGQRRGRLQTIAANDSSFLIRDCLDELQESKEHIDEILLSTSTVLDDLSSLSESFQAVESQTSKFEKQCEGLLNAQERDTKLANGIQNNLHYYDFLDPASRRLNAPGAGNTVRDKEFSDMLRRLDVCLDYMETHVSFVFLPFQSMDTIILTPCSPSKKKPRSTAHDTDYSSLAPSHSSEEISSHPFEISIRMSQRRFQISN